MASETEAVFWRDAIKLFVEEDVTTDGSNELENSDLYDSIRADIETTVESIGEVHVTIEALAAENADITVPSPFRDQAYQHKKARRLETAVSSQVYEFADHSNATYCKILIHFVALLQPSQNVNANQGRDLGHFV